MHKSISWNHPFLRNNMQNLKPEGISWNFNNLVISKKTKLKIPNLSWQWPPAAALFQPEKICSHLSGYVSKRRH